MTCRPYPAVRERARRKQRILELRQAGSREVVEVRTVVLYVLLAVSPAAAFLGGQRALERFTSAPRARSGRPAPSRAGDRPLDRLVLDLGRLERDYRDIERSGAPARARRLKAVELAYDDTLRACCRSVGLPAPRPTGMSALDRLQTEAALAQHGVHW